LKGFALVSRVGFFSAKSAPKLRIVASTIGSGLLLGLCVFAAMSFNCARAFAAPAGPDTYKITITVAVAPGETANVSVGTQVTAQISAIGSDGKTDATSAVPFAIGTTDPAADVTDDSGAAIAPTGLQLKSGTSHVLVTFKTAGSWTIVAIVNGVPIASAPIQVAKAAGAAPPAPVVAGPAPAAAVPAAAPAAAPPVYLFTTQALPAGGIQLGLTPADAAGLGPLSYSKVEGLPTSLPGTVSVSKTGVLTGNFGPNQAGSPKYPINVEDTKTSINYTATLPLTIQNPIKVTLAPGANTVTVMTGATGSIVAQLPAGATATKASPLDVTPWGFSETNAGGVYTFQTSGAKASGANKSFNYEIDYTDSAKNAQQANLIVDVEDSVTIPLAGGLTPTTGEKKKKPYDDLCQYRFNDCDWQYTVTGGAEESALSAQDSETNALVSLFLRGPWNLRSGSVWTLVRFLGAANANNTNNVVSAFTTATGSSSSAGLPQVGTALDYAIGYEHDWFQPNSSNPDRGLFTVGAIASFGATTPLSAQHATTAYVVPAWGTNECNQLISRFPSSAGSSGLPAQPSSPYITTTVTPTTGSPTTTTAGPYCVINNQPTTTTSSTGTTVVSGTAQTDIAFAPEDRNSFLLKYAVGLRLITRYNASGTTFCGTSSAPSVGVCSRMIVDLTVGQDEAITGGMLRHFVAKSDVGFPIPKTSVYFFGSAALRFTRNHEYSPLILQPATIVASSPTPPATITVPSSTTWVLPLTQPNRDFYRIGLGLDLSSVFSKIFTTTTTGK
jgi:hypothetical protein